MDEHPDELYRHYQFTLNEEFLETYTYPIMREWVRFMLDYLEEREDGLCHVPSANPYESASLRCGDTTNALAYIRLLFPIFTKTAQRMKRDLDLADQAWQASLTTGRAGGMRKAPERGH